MKAFSLQHRVHARARGLRRKETLSCDEYLNRKTLFAGEVNSGKTERTLGILRDLRGCGQGPLAVLDLAPEKVHGVGGKMPLTPQEKEEILYLSPMIFPPRLSGKNEEEIQRFAQENRQRTDQILEVLRVRKFNILIINDVSLYFHDGNVEGLFSWIEGIPTVIINGYYGRYFGESPLSRRERRQMEALMSRCDRVLLLPPIHRPHS